MRRKDTTADDLAIKAKKGDQKAKEELYARCERILCYLVQATVKKFPKLSKEDVQQELYFVFDRCIRTYIKKRGTFKSYFAHCAPHISAKLLLKAKIISLPHTFLTYRYKKQKGEYVPPTFEEIEIKVAAKFGSEIETVESEKPDDQASQNERKQIVLEAIASLPYRYQDIIKRYYGIGTFPQTSQQIADTDGVARQRIDQLRKQAVYHLKKFLKYKYKDGSF